MRYGKRIVVIIILSFFFYCNIYAAVPVVQDSLANTGTLERVSDNVLPSPFMVIPFIVLLLMIATGPLFYKHFWEHHYPKLAIILGLQLQFFIISYS